MSLDLIRAREIFEQSTDFTVGIEEEFQILDPQTLELAPRFEELQAAAKDDDELGVSVAGELISSEIEIRSGRGENFPHAVALQESYRGKLFAVAEREGILLGAIGAHPFSRWQDQRIIDTEHYRLVEEGLKYVAWRNNTFSLHVHVGVRGADRAIGVCDRVRELLPELLAISASSPFVDGRDSGLATARTQLFTRMFPRCGIPEPFGDWIGYADFIEFLKNVNSVVESTQLWWSVRPHHSYGTVEVRICDAQPTAERSTALAGLITACVAQAARDHDDGVPFVPRPGRELEENFWRAIRFGLDGKLIDLGTRSEYPAAAAAERLLEWSAPVRAELGIEPQLAERNATQAMREQLASGQGLKDVFAQSVEETRSSYGRTGASDLPHFDRTSG
ncbi:MAG: YbdK family carboxylate-amine ligase [Thermoleophilaceae bacterium]|nr:YbdK family carboxylate-amine ligase [Thermoleophilaceae bacterium]